MSNERKVMTPELMEELAGLLPMSNDSVHKFIPTSFQKFPKEYQPTFSVVQFDRHQTKTAKKIIDDMFGQVKTIITEEGLEEKELVVPDTEDDILELLNVTVKGWKNLKDYSDPAHKLVEYSIENIEVLSETLMGEIFKEILKITGCYPKKMFKLVDEEEASDMIDEATKKSTDNDVDEDVIKED